MIYPLIAFPLPHREQYAEDYANAKTLPNWQDYAVTQTYKLKQGIPAYRRVAEACFIPEDYWWIVGCIHMMESSFDFSKHLANGDPLSQRTMHVPVGLIKDKEPPYEWEEAAVAALEQFYLLGKLHIVDLPSALYFLEAYNGMGSMKKGSKSLYLWNGTTIGNGLGKYVTDGVWDAKASSEQLGCVAVIKQLQV